MTGWPRAGVAKIILTSPHISPNESGGLERACGMAIALAQDIAQAPALDAEPNLRELTRRTAETILNPLSTLATQ